jgi:hypothetical protein
MPNVTNKSLREAGVPPELWALAKKQCNSPAYKVKRNPHRAEGGPFATDLTGCPLWLDDAMTGPIRVGEKVGYYKSIEPAFRRGSQVFWGVVRWVKL